MSAHAAVRVRRVHPLLATRRALCARSGFTVLEVGVALAIVAIASLLVLPLWYGARTVDEAVHDEPFTSLLHTARAQAQLGRQRVRVIVDVTVGLVQLDTSGVGGDGTWQRLALDRETLAQLDGGVRRATFVFHPHGAAEGDSLRLRTAAGWRVLTVDPWSGEVRHAAR